MHITNNVHSDKIGIENIKYIYIPIFFFFGVSKSTAECSSFFFYRATLI